MKRRLFPSRYISILQAFWILSVSLALVAPEANAAEKYALLIGISDYIHNDTQGGGYAWPDLEGPENDVTLLKDVLVTRWGFKEENIVTLLSRQATRQNILKTIRSHLIEKPKAGDVVYFHYSGHGSTTEDTDGDEALLTPGDTRDETIVPSDSRDGAVFDITDDELHALFVKIPSNNVTMTFDSCNSGTVTRGFGVVTRNIPPDFHKRPRSPSTSGPVSEKIIERFTVLTAARPNEKAADMRPPGADAHYGLFTYHFARQLRRVPSGTKYDELWATVFDAVKSNYRYQSPQLEGQTQAVIFNVGNEKLPPPFIKVQGVENNTIQLAGGGILGVKKGEIYRVYKPDDFSLVGKGLARIQVIETYEDSARARFLSSPVQLPLGSKAVKISTPLGAIIPETISVSLEWNKTYSPCNLMATKLSGALNPSGWIKLDNTPRAKNVDAIIKLTCEIDPRARMTDEKLYNLRVTLTSEEYALPSEKMNVTIASVEDALEYLEPLLQRVFSIKIFQALENSEPSLNLDFSIVRNGESEPLSTRGAAITESDKERVFRIGKDKLFFHVKADRPCYLNIVSMGYTGQPVMLWPQAKGAANRISSGILYRLPRTDIEGENEIRFAPPTGEEFLFVMATSYPLDLHRLLERIRNHRIVTGSTRGAGLTIKEAFGQLATTRGVMKGRSPSSDVALASNSWLTLRAAIKITN